MSQSDKSKIRQSKEWKQKRKETKEKKKIDCVTLKPLRKGWNLHHLDLNEENYADLSDDSHFEPLNKQTHETVHFLYRYFVTDENVINRLFQLLKRMKEINQNDKK